jgi:response regulator RpfG family c-di-GMP phosphodiesterase
MKTPRPRIVVVDDEKYICKIVIESLASEDYEVLSFTSAPEAIAYIRENPVDLVLTDLVIGNSSGVQVMEATRETHEDAIVILMTAHPTIQTAISVLKKGAYDFLVKPFKLEALRAAIQRGLAHLRILQENLNLRSQVEFLKVASAVGTGLDTDGHLKLILSSCKTELGACGTAVLEVNPNSGRVTRRLFEADSDVLEEELLDESVLTQFAYSKTTKPVVKTERLTAEGVSNVKVFISQPIFIRKTLHGVLNVLIISRFETVTPGQLDVLSILANSAASTMANNILYLDLQDSYLQAIRALANAIEARDACTGGHTDRVSRLAAQVARELGWDESRQRDLLMGCMLHDIGKLGVPDSILNKSAQLTPEEHEIMLNHPMVGLRIVSGIDLLKPAIPYICSHHERYDGSGYPRGLKGQEIPIEGRLLAVVDTFDAILSDRPYREGASIEVAISELIEHKGAQFDPHLVDVFLRILQDGRVDLSEMYDREFDRDRLAEIMAQSGEKVPTRADRSAVRA